MFSIRFRKGLRWISRNFQSKSTLLVTAFEMTWETTCNAVTSNAEMILPKGMTFLVYPMTSGTITAPDSPDAWEGRDQGQWLIFDSGNGHNVDGGGLIMGVVRAGGISHGCVKLAPTVLSFLKCSKVSMRKISVVNSPQTHILITGSNNFAIDS